MVHKWLGLVLHLAVETVELERERSYFLISLSLTNHCGHLNTLSALSSSTYLTLDIIPVWVNKPV